MSKGVLSPCRQRQSEVTQTASPAKAGAAVLPACLQYALASFPGVFASQNAYSGTAALVDEYNKNTVAAEHTGVSDGLVPKHQ